MKSNLLILLVLIALVSFNNLATAQVISCGTPNCLPLHDDNYWMINEAEYGSRKLSGCDPNTNYNCHGFTMSYFEVSCNQPGWNNAVSTPYLCPNIIGARYDLAWQNSGSYIQVCSETEANIAYYHLTNGDTHSAVKEILTDGSFKYLSKYGCDGPIVAHDLTRSVYHLKGQVVTTFPLQFWSYLRPISGNPTIIGTNSTTFYVNDISNISYSWSIISGYSNISITAGANQHEVTLTPYHSGTAELQLIAVSSCGVPKTQKITLKITTNVCLEGTYDNSQIYNQNLNTTNRVSTGGVTVHVSCPNASTITWQKTSGNINGFFPNTGPLTSFTMTSGGSISFLVTAKDGSTILVTRSITFYNY
jgi:hypothetical protein